MRILAVIQKNVSFIALLLALAALPLPAQEEKSEERLRFNIDYTRSRYSDSLSFCEFYALLPRKQLTYLPDGGSFKAEFKVTAEVFLQDSLVSSKIWKNVNHTDSLSTIESGQNLFFLNHFILSEGDYEMSLLI